MYGNKNVSLLTRTTCSLSLLNKRNKRTNLVILGDLGGLGGIDVPTQVLDVEFLVLRCHFN